MRRLNIVRFRPGYMVDDEQMRRRGFAVRHIGPWLVTWCKRPEEWKL